jgi:hypothetical protein
MTDYSKLGTHTLLHRANARHGRSQGHRPGTAQAVARPGRPVVGWTSPEIIYDKMRSIDSGAKELDVLMRTNVREPVVLAAWKAWYAQWLAFFARHQSKYAQFGTLLFMNTDELAGQTEEYRRTYESFRATYALQRDASGNPLPQPSTPIPVVLTPGATKKEDGSSGGIQIPWWFWVVGGVGVTVGGYFLYKNITRTAHELRAKKRALDTAMPTLLQGYGVPREISQAAVASDPSHRPSTMIVPSEIFVDAQIRDPAPRPEPRERPSYERHERHERHETEPRHAASWRDPE